MKALLACWLTAVAVLVWMAMSQPGSFQKRWPVALPPAMAVQTFNAARKAAARQAFCRRVFNECGIG